MDYDSYLDDNAYAVSNYRYSRAEIAFKSGPYYFDYLNDIILMTHINDLYMISLFISLTNVLSSFTLIASTRWRWRAVKLQSLYDSE